MESETETFRKEVGEAIKKLMLEVQRFANNIGELNWKLASDGN